MRRAIAQELVAPGNGAALNLDVFKSDGDRVIEGVLREPDGAWHPIIDGLPIFRSEALQPDLTEFATAHGLAYAPPPADTTGQAETNTTFSDKWRRFTTYGWADQHWDFHAQWFVKKLGLDGVEDLARFYGQFERVLECGTGSGFNLNFISKHARGEVFGLDISDAAVTSHQNLRDLPNLSMVRADLFHAPFADDSFDFVIADGVLHHTPSTRGAVEALYKKVKPGGKFFFYIYKRMGPARYFVDQHIRESFTKLTPEECYEACHAITELGRELSKIDTKINLENAIPSLGLPAGEHNVQRFVYYGFMKCFWNDAFDFETNNMINYDWYHPHHAWQHTEEEVTVWLTDLGVKDFNIYDANPNGLSVLVTKPL